MKKPRKPELKDLPEAITWPPKDLHKVYARRGAAAATAATARRRRLAALEKKP